MKKIIFTLASSLIIFSAAANRGFSELNIRLFDNSVFYMILDNVPYNYCTSNYKFENLQPGGHFITVVRQQSVGYYNTPVTLFTGWINIPANMKIFSMIDMYGGYMVISQYAMLNPDDSYNYGSYSDWNYYEGYDVNYIDYTPGISGSSFLSLLSLINSATFESSKISIAKQAINSNFMTSAQLLQILKCFTFESSKLEIAKLAYSKVVDKENFFMVNEAFTFDSSIDELNQYISGQ